MSIFRPISIELQSCSTLSIQTLLFAMLISGGLSCSTPQDPAGSDTSETDTSDSSDDPSADPSSTPQDSGQSSSPSNQESSDDTSDEESNTDDDDDDDDDNNDDNDDDDESTVDSGDDDDDDDNDDNDDDDDDDDETTETETSAETSDDTTDEDSDDSSSSETGEVVPCLEQIKIDKDYLKEKVSELSGEIPIEIDGKMVTLSNRKSPQNREYTRKYLLKELEAIGMTASLHEYNSGKNVVGDRKSDGDASETVIISGHFDSVSNSCPGADDDAAGLVTAIAAAKALRECKIGRNLRVLGFDEEEIGLVGSKAYARDVKNSGEKIVGVFQWEMTGYDSDDDGAFTLVDCDRSDSQFLTDSLLNGIKEGNLSLSEHKACVSASDHQSFWDQGIPAIVASEWFFGSNPDKNPCYHQACDKVDRMNFDFMAKITTAAAYALAEQAKAE